MDYKSCNNCIDSTLHEYIETWEETIENYKPYTGKRYLKSRPATITVEIWKCSKCGYLGKFNTQTKYEDLRKRRDN